MRISLLSPAKLNLFLHILGKRSDGYHELQTLFQLLDYGDHIHFELSDDDTIVLLPDIAGVSYQDNLIIKAALALRAKTGISKGAKIEIEKRLPMGGGLGGGSSNAATTLIALNQLWRTGLSTEELCEIGLNLGADVPVFIQGRSAWAEGIGEKLQAVDLPEQWFIVIKPDCHVPTADIFSREELTRDTAAITVAAFFEQGGQNDCENVVCRYYPEVDVALKWLRKYAPAQLTGTGACIFATFPNKDVAKNVLKEVPERWDCFIAKGINHSPAMSLIS
ncbi:MAG: 4-(cytidine 5'-diphospho)-2-C-methyl-D-erythritol kinase [Cellvibrionaceae bacterium]